MSVKNEGKRVAWENRGHKHEGEIVAYVPAGRQLRAHAHLYGQYPMSKVQDISEVARYLIREDRTGVRGKSLRPKWYVTHVSVIDKALTKEQAAAAEPKT